MLDKSKKTFGLSFGEKTIFYSFAILPLSFIAGNFVLNLNIIIIDLFFLYFFFKYKLFKSYNYKIEKYLIILLVILAINISIKNLGYLFDTIALSRFIIFFSAFIFLLNKLKKKWTKLFYLWFFIIAIVSFDVLFEVIFGHNTFGFVSPSSERIASFFKSELIVGFFLLSFSYFAAPILLLKKKYNILILFLILISFLIFLSGERSNFIKSLIILITCIFFLKKEFELTKKKVLAIILILGILFLSSLYFFKGVYERQRVTLNQIYLSYQQNNFKNLTHYLHFLAASNLIKENLFTGVGNKNYRAACLFNKKNISELGKNNLHLICSTHPHSFYLEQIAENGFIIFLLMFFYLCYFLKMTLINLIKSKKKYLSICSIILIFTYLLPLPTGRFFTTTNATVFFLHLAFIYFIYCKNRNYNLKTF